MNKLLIFLFLIFVIGWLSSSVYSQLDLSLEKPFSLFRLPEKASPYDRVKEDQIHVFDSKVVIDINNARWATFTDTNSMDPVIDENVNAIEIVPKSPLDIHVGDIVSYKSNYLKGTVIHRIVEIGYDKDGWYAILKGDNNPKKDPEKVRFYQIKRITVAIIY